MENNQIRKESIIIFTNNIIPNNGIGVMSKNIFVGLQNRGEDVIAFVDYHRRSSEYKQKEYNVLYLPTKNLLFLPLYVIYNVIKTYTLLKYLNIKPSKIIVLYEPYWLEGFIVSKIFRSEYIIFMIGTYSIRMITSPYSYIYKLVLLFSDKIFSISNYTKTKVCNFFPKIREKIIVNYIGCSLLPTLSYKKAKEIVRSYGVKLEKNVPIFLTVGPLKRRKGQLLSIILLLSAIEEGYNILYINVGKNESPSYYEKLKSLVGKNKHNFLFIQKELNDEELSAFYIVSDFYIMPSLNTDRFFEGFGMVYLEAMEKGCIPIGCKHSSFSEIVEDGKNGFILDCLSLGESYEKLINILDIYYKDKRTLKKIKLASKRTSEVYRWNKTIQLIMR